MKRLLIKCKTEILYLIFGFATTLVSLGVFSICYYMLSVSNVASNIISWGVSVLFAYVVNKVWVFENREYGVEVLFKEFTYFVFCRIFSGALEVFIMYISVDVLNLVAWFFKIIATAIVITCNYLASNIIFRKK